jgi:hypothetical protein
MTNLGKVVRRPQKEPAEKSSWLKRVERLCWDVDWSTKSPLRLAESDPIVLSAKVQYAGLSRRYTLLFKAPKKKNDEDEGFFLLLRLSYSFLILSSFLGSHFRASNPDIFHDSVRGDL